jgi:hypothetical protein
VTTAEQWGPERPANGVFHCLGKVLGQPVALLIVDVARA